MLAIKGINRAIVSALILASVVLLLFATCDRRRALDYQERQASDVSNIIINIDPPQINLPTATAIDSAKIWISVINSDGVGLDSVIVSITREPEIGFLTSPAPTDSNGITLALFIAEPGVFGRIEIKVTAGDTLRTSIMYITGPSDYTLTVDHSPSIPKLIDRNGDPYVITATLVDTARTGVPGQPVEFSILNNVGRLVDTTGSGAPPTNIAGLVSVLFYNTSEDETTNPDSVIIQAVTTSPTDTLAFFATSTVLELIPVNNSLDFDDDSLTVIGDGSDSLVIRAILLDTYGHGIMGDTVRFRNQPFHGSIAGTAVTDENGIAESVYRPFPGHLGATRIFAEYGLQTIHEAIDTVDVDILPVLSIGFIDVSLQKQSVTANGVDSTEIYITVSDSSGGLISDGTAVFLEHSGTGFLSPTQATTISGQAVATLIAPSNIVNAPNVDSVIVWGNANDSVIVADTVVVTYIPGPVDELVFIRPETTVTLIAGSGATDTVQVSAVDANGNPVANGTQITFTNQIVTSSLTPSAAQTMDGVATSIYLIGSETGDDNVRAFVPDGASDTIWTVQPVVYRCLSSEATTLQLSASQGSIEVGGASCQIIATLQDAFGNPLSEGYNVAFQIIVAPGTDPPQRPSFDTEPGVEHDTMDTNINGQAVVQIYSGTESGAVSIRACTISDTLFVCDEKSLITISSGPPATVIAHYNVTAEATNPQTPERYVQVAAQVFDVYANPVEYGTAVYFTLLPNDIADVEGNSFTGGSREPYHPDSFEGWAYSRILFGCAAALNSIQVVATSAGDSSAIGDTSAVFLLPIYAPVISLLADPGNLWCDDALCTTVDDSDIMARLTDGGGCAVEGGQIVFSALVAGSIIGPTSVYTDSIGIAETIYRIRGCEIPEQGGIPTIEAKVKASLFGYPAVEEMVSITCSRPQ